MSLRTPHPPWYAEGLRFSCTQCGRCCGGAPGYVWVSPSEIEQIGDFLGLSIEDFMRCHVRRVVRGFSLLERANGDCEFLEHVDGDGVRTRCRIHPVRPIQCRTWPFWASNVSSSRAWEATAHVCPGIDHGEHHPLPVIQAALDANGDRPL